MLRIEDYLWVETDDSCALCGSREARALTIHHIDGNHTNNTYDNRIVLCHNCHQRFHAQDGDITEGQIRDRKRHLIVKTLTHYGVNALKLACRRRHVVGAPFLLDHLVDLGLLERGRDIMSHTDDGKDSVVSVCQYLPTTDGVRIVEEWF